MNTRYPRTLQDAFGPYTSREIHEPKHRTPLSDVICWALVVLLLLWIATVAIWHGFGPL